MRRTDLGCGHSLLDVGTSGSLANTTNAATAMKALGNAIAAKTSLAVSLFATLATTCIAFLDFDAWTLAGLALLGLFGLFGHQMLTKLPDSCTSLLPIMAIRHERHCQESACRRLR
jgi:hypothetical protein